MRRLKTTGKCTIKLAVPGALAFPCAVAFLCVAASAAPFVATPAYKLSAVLLRRSAFGLSGGFLALASEHPVQVRAIAPEPI